MGRQFHGVWSKGICNSRVKRQTKNTDYLGFRLFIEEDVNSGYISFQGETNFPYNEA